MKNPARPLAVASLAVLLSFAAGKASRAQGVEDLTGFAVHRPLMVGSVQVEPGNYLLRVVAAGSTRNVLQVVEPEKERVLVTVLATPRELSEDRIQPSSALDFGLPPGSAIPSLRSWIVANSRFAYDFYVAGAPAERLAAGTPPPATLIALAR